MSSKERTQRLEKMAQKETEGMDFTYLVDQIKGKELTVAQKTTKNAVDKVFAGKKKS